jgi:hypothetical protein
MLAILYIAAAVWFGDVICRSFYRSYSVQQRLSHAFLVGLLLSSVITYLGALAFYRTAQPLIWGNLIFLAVFALAARWLPRRRSKEYLDAALARPTGQGHWDWLFLFVYFSFGWWLFSHNLNFHDGNLQFGFKSWSDYGANLSVAQSLVLGHNFPTEHPFYPGPLIRYHFMFWFQVGNLSYLGLNLAWCVNLLSIMSLMAVLSLIMTLAELFFNSRAVARIAAGLFFFASSSLAYIPFLRSQPTWEAARNAILNMGNFLPTGYPYRGEDWGALSFDVFINQRHLISGTGLLLLVVVCLTDYYKYKTANEPVPEPMPNPAPPPETETLPDPTETAPPAEDAEAKTALPEIPEASKTGTPAPPSWEITPAEEVTPAEEIAPAPETAGTVASETLPPLFKYGPDLRENLGTLLFSGFLIGALPFWNSAVFVAALILLGGIWLFLPYRLYVSCVLGTAVLVGLPQVLMLKSGDVIQQEYSLFRLGYTIAEPTVPLVLQYVAWTFGFKWLLLLIALVFLSRTHLRFFLAFSILLALVFLLQLSTDAFNNHKLINIWNIFALSYAAYAIWRVGRGAFPRKILAAALTLAMIAGAVIDLFPVINDPLLRFPMKDDRLAAWLLANTKPNDVFLSQTLLSHQILFTGRKVFLGNTLFAWTAGYNCGIREAAYKQMFSLRDTNELLQVLRENNISYVAIDDGVRNNHLVKERGLNEEVYQRAFPKVFEDTEKRYDNLTIYQVPK